MVRLFVSLLGGFQVRLDSGRAVALPTRKAQALLAYLALPAGRPHPREALAALLWGGIREESARASLRQALFAIRKAVGEQALVVEGASVALAAHVADVDADTFAQAVAQGSPEALARAETLYKGDLLAGLVVDEPAWEEWLLGERERCRELALEGLAKLLAHQRRAGATEAATRAALKLLALDPLQEPVHRALMRLYADLGRRGAALRQYQQCVTVLQRELGIEPEAETKELYQEIVQRRTSRTVGDAVVSTRVDDGGATAGIIIGRDAEIATLRKAGDDATTGSARMIALVGDAGIGKSRLVLAFTAQARAGRARVMLGRCYENERMLPFAPWIEALRAARLTTDDPDVRALDPVVRAELARMLPELGSPDLPPAGDDRTRLFAAVTTLVERLARTPLVIVLEDVHWADDVSVALLAYVRRRVERACLAIVVTARAEEVADATTVRRTLADLENEQRLVSTTLTPLDREATVELVRALARAGSEPSMAEKLAADIWHASEGHPFMIVELIRAMEQGAASAARRPLPLPDRVRQVIAARLERLGAHARELTEVAAVIGRPFEFGLLQRASGLGGLAAAAVVEELVRRRVLHGIGERFDFMHDRIREVAYDAIFGPRRALLHRQVAQSIEALFAADLDAHALALARHYREAGVWDRAVSSFRRAAAYAMSHSAYQEAAACLEEGLAALRHLPPGREALESAVDLRFDLRTALYPLGEQERTLACMREATRLAEELGDDRRRGRAAAYLCVALRRAGDFEGAVEAGERALSLGAAMADVSLQVATTLYLGQALWVTGAGRRAVEVLRRNVTSLTGEQLRQRHGAPGYPGVFSMTDMASHLAELGEFDEARRVGVRGVALAEELGQPFTTIAAHIGVATMRIAGGEFADAIVGLERARALCDRGDFGLARVAIEARLGSAYALSGRLAEGLSLLEDAARHVDRVDGFWRPRLLGWLAEAYLLDGRVDDAARIAEHAAGITPPNAPISRAWTIRLAAEVASHGASSERHRAIEHYRDAAELAETLELRLVRAHCHLGLGRLYRMAGDARAREELSSAIDAFDAMGVAYWRATAESEALKL